MTADTIIFIVYSITAGIVIAFIWSLLTKAIYGKLVDALIKFEAEDEESAKTFEELDVKESPLFAYSLNEKRTLGRLIKKCDKGYFLPPEAKLKAQSLYSGEKLTPISIIVTFLLFILIIFLCNRILPIIMK
jgi:hypothetical protein